MSVKGPNASVASAGCCRKFAAVVVATLGWPCVCFGSGAALAAASRLTPGRPVTFARFSRKAAWMPGVSMVAQGAFCGRHRRAPRERVGLGAALHEHEAGLGAELADARA
jgi:hypothetical protein